MNRQAEFTGHRMDIDPGGRVPVNRFLCELIRVNHDLTTVSHDPPGREHRVRIGSAQRERHTPATRSSCGRHVSALLDLRAFYVGLTRVDAVGATVQGQPGSPGALDAWALATVVRSAVSAAAERVSTAAATKASAPASLRMYFISRTPQKNSRTCGSPPLPT